VATREKWNDDFLNQARMKGDPLADQALSDMMNRWPKLEELSETDSQAHESIRQNMRWAHAIVELLKPVRTNRDLSVPLPEETVDRKVRQGLQHFLSVCRDLPDWADLGKIKRAEKLFQDSGVLSCVLFFCSSLPEVYVIPDISTVLHATGNLERITDQRIRSTAIMILTVLLPGGLSDDEGGGRPQVLKARLIHSVIRNLVLRGNPAHVVAHANEHESAPLVDAILMSHPPRNMLEMTLTHGWDPFSSGVPINQEELAYTLLTFSFVYLRSLRRLGLRFSKSDEEAYLHFWNIVGHVIGLESNLMVSTMKEGKMLFQKLQARARAIPLREDPRANLGQALINLIEKSIRFRSLKPMASLITEYLTSPETAKDLGFSRRMTFPSRILFSMVTGSVKLIDFLVRKLIPNFSLARFCVRIVGYQLLNKVLTDPEQPIDLPDHLRDQIQLMLHQWSHDPNAPSWLNSIEDYFTTHGSWSETIQT
jgi:hypothetical protein